MISGKRFLKTTLLIIAGLGVILFVSILYIIRFSKRARETYDNVENSKKLTIGMKLEEVHKIMGEPDTIYNEGLDNSEILYYEPPFAASDGIDVYFDSTKTVTRIKMFE